MREKENEIEEKDMRNEREKKRELVFSLFFFSSTLSKYIFDFLFSNLRVYYCFYLRGRKVKVNLGQKLILKTIFSILKTRGTNF